MNSTLLMEAAARSVFLALAVWMFLGLLKVRNVMAQKAAWGLVLAGALAMPLVLPLASHWTVLPANVRVVLPADPQTLLEELQARIQAKTSPEVRPSGAAAAAGEGAPEIEQQGLSVTKPSAERAAAATEPEFSDADRVEYVQAQPIAKTETAETSAVAPARAALSLSKILLLLYFAVAAVFLIRLACGLIAALRLSRRAKPISVEMLTDSGECVDLRCSSEVSSPVTICSAIVLPADYARWDREKLRVVLAHERSHIRQKDFYLQLLAEVYAAVVWFSPLGWWLKRKLSDLAEAISDRAGLEEAADRASYAQILLEFAAAPRPTLIGVAMARNGSLSRRIERLLNDASFRQAFAGSRRALFAVLVVPVTLFAATALVRVEAAGQQAPEPPAPAAAPVAGVPAPPAVVAPVPPVEGVTLPQQISDEDVPPPVPAAGAVPSLPGAPGVTPLPQLPKAPEGSAPNVLAPVAPAAAPHVPAIMTLPASPEHGAMILVAPKAPSGHALMVMPHVGYGEGRGYGAGQSATTESGTSSYSNNGKHSGYRYSYSSNGESYAVVRGGDKEHLTFSGNWIEGRQEEIEKARKQAGGKDFLWFTRDGKGYFVDDPASLAQIEAMYKPMEDLGKQQEELGKKQEALGKQQEDIGKQQEAASVPTPDMSKEIAKIDEAMAKLKASEGNNMTPERLAELQERVGELQGRLGEIQGRIGERQGEFGARMGELGAKMGELGARMGELGARQGKLAQDADQRVRSIIDQSLQNGKAHPVQ